MAVVCIAPLVMGGGSASDAQFNVTEKSGQPVSAYPVAVSLQCEDSCDSDAVGVWYEKSPIPFGVRVQNESMFVYFRVSLERNGFNDSIFVNSTAHLFKTNVTEIRYDVFEEFEEDNNTRWREDEDEVGDDCFNQQSGILVATCDSDYLYPVRNGNIRIPFNLTYEFKYVSGSLANPRFQYNATDNSTAARVDAGHFDKNSDTYRVDAENGSWIPRDTAIVKGSVPTGEWMRFQTIWNHTRERIIFRIDGTEYASAFSNRTELAEGTLWIFSHANFGELESGDTGNTARYHFDNLTVSPRLPNPPQVDIIPKNIVNTPQHPLIISNSSWRNVLAATPADAPLLVTDRVTPQHRRLIDAYGPEDVFVLGDVALNGLNATRLDRNGLRATFFPDAGERLYVEGREKAVAAAQLARAQGVPVVFEPRITATDLTGNTTGEIREAYVREVSQREDMNHIVLYREGGAAGVYAPFIATRRRGVAVPVLQRGGSNAVRDVIAETGALLERYGGWTASDAYYTEGLYLSFVGGVPSVRLQDPVEQRSPFDDPRDGDTFRSDLPYGDLNNDTYLDAAVGRYPADIELTSAMFLRGGVYRDEKDALVASEYLHTNWPVILAYLGGGMWAGKSVEGILEGRGYVVDRAVEYRADPANFLVELSPANMQAIMDDQREMGAKVGAVVGESVGDAASTALTYVKALEYVQRGMQQYLEFDWATFGFDADRGFERIAQDGADLAITDPRFLANATKKASRRAAKERSVKEAIVASLQGEQVQQAIAEAVYVFLWPDRYAKLTEATLQERLPEQSIVYYEGVGNGSAWHLPNAFNHATSLEWVKTGRYNGSRNLMPSEVPPLRARFVVDNSDLAGQVNMSRDELWRAFLEAGAATYMGTSTVNYAPYASEVDTRFFRNGYTAGKSLVDALNAFRDDWITWDPFNAAVRGTAVKRKMLRSYRFYGDPTIWKDPVAPDRLYTIEQRCRRANCTLTATIDLNYTIEEQEGTRGIAVEADGSILRTGKPRIPTITVERLLPQAATVHDHSITARTRNVSNVTVPVTTPLTHGGVVHNTSTNTTGWFPEQPHRFTANRTLDNRTRLHLVQAAYQYDDAQGTARLFEQVNLTVSYTTPYTLNVAASDTLLDAEAPLTVTVHNPERVPVNGTVLLRVGNATSATTLKRSVVFSTSQATEQFTYTPPAPGTYTVEAFLRADGQVVGPRTTTFTVADPEELAAQLAINEVHPDPAPNRSEYVELYNPTAYALRTDALALEDAAGNAIPLPTTLPSGFGVAETAAVLNNGGDTVTLRRCPPSETVQTVTYPEPASAGEAIPVDHTGMGLRVVAVVPDAVGSDANESLVLQNTGNTTANLTRYALVEEDRHDELVGTLAPNATERVEPSITLNNGGDTFQLVSIPACTRIDALTYEDSTENRSIGRAPNGGTRITAMVPTPGAPNPVPAGTGDASGLVLNEVLPDSATDWDGDGVVAGDDDQFIELYNPAEEAVALDGIVVADAAGNENSLSDSIPAQSHRVFYDPLGLNNNGDTVLLRYEGEVIDRYRYSAVEPDVAHGRSPDGTGAFRDLPPSPGQPNPVIIERTTGSSPDDEGDVEAGFVSLDIPDTVYEGVPFTVEALIENPGRFEEVYSYGYVGNEPVTVSPDGDASWTGNAQQIGEGMEEVTLRSIVENGTQDMIDLAVKAKGAAEIVERTTLRVRDRPTLTVAEHVLPDKVIASFDTTCDVCTIRVRTPDRTLTLDDTTELFLDRDPGTYLFTLQDDGQELDTARFTIPEPDEEDGSAGQDTVTARGNRSDTEDRNWDVPGLTGAAPTSPNRFFARLVGWFTSLF